MRLFVELLYRDLALIFEGKGKVIGEFLIKFSEDRPGILAALSNVFADHGINILNISVNRSQLLLHFVVDMTEMDVTLNDLEKEFQRFSFVQWIRYRVIDGATLMMPSMIMPTFRDRQVFIIDLDELIRAGMSSDVRRLIKEVGASDAELFRDVELSELVRIGQFRGLGKVSLSGNDELVIESCSVDSNPEDYAEIIYDYYASLLGKVHGSKVEIIKVTHEGGCVSVSLRLRK